MSIRRVSRTLLIEKYCYSYFHRRERILSEIIQPEYIMWITSYSQGTLFRIDQVIRVESNLADEKTTQRRYLEDEDDYLDDTIDFD